MTYEISIHALLAESDSCPQASGMMHAYFYPRSPCGERLKPVRDKRTLDQFLSTLSLRRATKNRHHPDDAPYISIHALLAESDLHRN